MLPPFTSKINDSAKNSKILGPLHVLSQEDDDDDVDQPENKTKEEEEPSMTLYEMARREEEASKRIRDSMLFPYRLGRAINFVGWGFLLSTFLLEYLGYGYMQNPSGPGIVLVTLEEREFQAELRKSSKEQQQQQQRLEPASRSIQSEALLRNNER
jgi:hypothetical protein